jgi:hypothetical protein
MILVELSDNLAGKLLKVDTQLANCSTFPDFMGSSLILVTRCGLPLTTEIFTVAILSSTLLNLPPSTHQSELLYV